MLKSIVFFSFYIAICISQFPLFPHISNRWISAHLIIAALKRKSIEVKNKWSWCWMAIVYRNIEEVLPPSDRLSDGDKSSPNLSIAMTVNSSAQNYDCCALRCCALCSMSKVHAAISCLNVNIPCFLRDRLQTFNFWIHEFGVRNYLHTRSYFR